MVFTGGMIGPQGGGSFTGELFVPVNNILGRLEKLFQTLL